MYILIKDSVDIGHALLACAHGSLSCYLRTPEFRHWWDLYMQSFRKVVCKVTDKEFEKAKTYIDCHYIIVTESGLNDMETALVFVPRGEWPEFFKSLKLYK